MSWQGETETINTVSSFMHTASNDPNFPQNAAEDVPTNNVISTVEGEEKHTLKNYIADYRAGIVDQSEMFEF